MSDLSYRLIFWLCYPLVWVTSRAVVLHADRAARSGAYILAANHLSPFDVPLMMKETPRNLDFLSIKEMQHNPLIRWLYGWMNTFFMDRWRNDPAGARMALDRLKNGRVVAMFPEAQIRTPQNSVISGGRIKPGVAHLATSAQVPIIPCVVLDASTYGPLINWLPLRRARYGVIFGEPIMARRDVPQIQARRILLEELRQTYPVLAKELRAQMDRTAVAD